MNFEILSTIGKDKTKWSSLIQQLIFEKRDIHFLPEYGLIYKESFAYEPFLAVLRDKNEYVIQPFVRRNINTLCFFKNSKIKRDYYDIANAYGYGGPICNCKIKDRAIALLKSFNQYFLNFCKDQKFICEFTSFNPLLKNHLLIDKAGYAPLTRQKEIVYVDLNQSESDIWKTLSRGQKSNINHAKKIGVQVKKVTSSKKNLNYFNKLYYQTMVRRKAEQRWFLPANYFENCFRYLGPKRTSMFFAYIGKQITSAYFLIHDFSIAYYHFAGLDSRFLKSKSSNILMYKIILWTKKNGYRYFHLGGGVSSNANDGLMQFKRGFSKNLVTLYTYQRIFDKTKYDRLCLLKRRYEHNEHKNYSKIKNSYFFPMYRRE